MKFSAQGRKAILKVLKRDLEYSILCKKNRTYENMIWREKDEWNDGENGEKCEKDGQGEQGYKSEKSERGVKGEGWEVRRILVLNDTL